MPIKKESIKSTHRIRRTKSESKDDLQVEHHIEKKEITNPTHRIRRTISESKDIHIDVDDHHAASRKGHSKITHRIRKTSSDAKAEHADDHHTTHKKGHTKPLHGTHKAPEEPKAAATEDESLDKKSSEKQIKEFCWTSNKTGADKANENESSKSVTANGFRWAAEFMAGPGGFLEKTEVVSEWFETLEEAKVSAFEKAENEICDYPFSRGNILKLIVEDKNGNEIVLKNSTKDT